jgi:hypothetical protein
MSSRWFKVHVVRPIQPLLRWKWARPTVAVVTLLVIGGYGFAHGEPGAKKALAGVAAGTGIAVLAVNVLSWLWGV